MARSGAQTVDDGQERGMPRQGVGRRSLDPDLSGLNASTRARVEDVMSRMPTNNSNFNREEAAPAAEGVPAEKGHGGHGAPAKKKPGIKTIDVDWADVKGAIESVSAANKAFKKGELDKPTLTRAVDDTLDAIPLPGMDKLRYALPLIMWVVAKATGLPDHPPHKIAPNYTDLAGQILGFYPDEDDPRSYHHSVEGLMANINEMDLHRHYSLFFHQPNFTKALSNAKGQKKANEQFSKLFGPDIETRDQFLDESAQVLLRLGCTITPGPTPADPSVGEVIHIHDLRNVHANHSLHSFVQAIRNARQWVNATNLGQIAEPATEDVKLNKDINKFGDTLMEQVKGTPGLVVQFLGNINLAAYDKAFHSLANDLALEGGMYEEADLVKEQICQLFNFSAKERISTDDLNNFTETLIGPTTVTPAVPPYALDANNGGALGLLSAIPATDTATRAKWTAVRTRVNEARARLLASPTGGTGTRLEVLFPPKSETIDYTKFGAQLGKTVRGKAGVNLERARTSFLRGWEEDEFRNHFLTLIDGPTLASAASGSKAEKEEVKAKIAEVTGLNVKKVTRVMFTNRINALRVALGTAAPLGPVTGAANLAKRAALDGLLTDMLAPGGVDSQIEALYLDADLNEKLGEALQSATDAATVTAILDRITPAFLMGHYPRVQTAPVAVLGNPAAVPPVPPMSLTNQQLFKTNLAAFIGAPKGFVWSDAAVSTMIGVTGGLRAKLALVPPAHTGRAAMEAWITYVDGFVATPGFITHLGTLP